MASEKPTSRRDFLRGKSAARALIDAAQSLADRAASAIDPSAGESAAAGKRTSPGGAAHLYASRRAMACEFAIQYHAADGPDSSDAVLAALDLLEPLEAQLTIYRDRSEVVDLNRTAADREAPVNPQLFELIERCAQLYAETGGAFDITSGPLSRAWGFLRREGRLPAENEIAAALRGVGFHHVALNPAKQTVHYRQMGVEVNFNAVGKGYALDRIAQFMAQREVSDFLCHGGASSVLARGRDRSEDCGGWRIGVPHPHQREHTIGDIILRNESLGTSGAGTQYFEAEGRRFGHLIDPRTGWPAEGVYTATVVADSAATADALSTAFYIMGASGASEYCAAHPHVAAVLVCPRHDADSSEFDVHAFNLDAARWRPAAS